MACTQFGDLLESRREFLKLAAAPQALDCTQLFVRGTARPDEVGMVGIREAVGAGSSRGHYCTLFEEEHGLRCAGKGQHVGDRLQSLRVGDRVPAAIEHAELDPLLTRELRQKRRPFHAGASDLEMWGARAA